MPYTIASFFDLDQPAKTEELANQIEVTTQPLTPAAVAAEVYRTREPISIGDGATIATTCLYNSPPVLPSAVGGYAGASAVAYETDADGTLLGPTLTITAATYYAWGGEITVQNGLGHAAYFKIAITGHALNVDGEEVYSTEDTGSIVSNGLRKYQLKKNALVQSLTMAATIADGLLAAYKMPRKDIALDWRGYPALELGDEITVPTYNKNGVTTNQDFVVVRQTLQFDGTLRARLDGRLVV